MNSTPIPVLVLFGATACGKTALADRLFSADADSPFAGMAEVISADSMQVYRGMDIGTAKPDASLRQRLPHYLIDIHSPADPFGAGEFVRLADECCAEIFGRGKIPLIMGGTAFYIKNFICGLPPTPEAEPAVRIQLQNRLKQDGAEVLYAELRKTDPESALKIHPNDAYRILRALEIYYTTGKPLSKYRLPLQTRSQYRFCTIILVRDRKILYERIALRVEQMFRSGLAQEFESLVYQGFTEQDPGMQAIGYREFFTVRQSDFDSRESWLRAVKAQIITDSRHYAKRQETFFRGIPSSVLFDADDYEGIVKHIAAFKNEANH